MAASYLREAWQANRVGDKDFLLFLFENTSDGEDFLRNNPMVLDFQNIVAMSLTAPPVGMRKFEVVFCAQCCCYSIRELCFTPSTNSGQ